MPCTHDFYESAYGGKRCAKCGKHFGEGEKEMAVRYRPRNDLVLVRKIDVGQTREGIMMPEVSIQGKKFQVEAMGPDVDDLDVGDFVMMIGKPGDDYYPLPNENDLIVIHQKNVALVVEETESN